ISSWEQWVGRQKKKGAKFAAFSVIRDKAIGVSRWCPCSASELADAIRSQHPSAMTSRDLEKQVYAGKKIVSWVSFATKKFGVTRPDFLV
ncbi:hypothetical protein QU894_29355, partial [Citrobacter freundii]|uniref:hypothetical protein n=1 Tax=Citrobacter freundii TaxID=546 RepID=UPI0038B7F5F0